jgi:glycosyltransferase involved in cell wall biosynthesis
VDGEIMKILHLNYSDVGGAGGAARRLNQALINEGIDSSLLVSRKHGDHPFVKELPPVSNALARTRSSLAYRVLAYTGFLKEGFRSVNALPTRLHTLLNASDADVIHLHWINAEMINIAELAKIKKPVVWTLHDMWPFCGAEHVTTDSRYVTGYQSSEFRVQGSEGKGQTTEDGEQIAKEESPNVSSLRTKAFFDLDRWVFKRKQKHWKNWFPTIVTPSKWLAECARESMLFKSLPVQTIPNCLNLDVFTPMDSASARKKFNLPLDKKLILFGAYSPLDKNKGGDLLEAALKQCRAENVEVVVFGADGNTLIAGLPTRWVGKIREEACLAELYNAADLFVAPSRVDNLPNTVAEAISCGTPVAAFNIGGIPDMVEHEQNGYLAQSFNTDDLLKGIEWVVNLSENDAVCLRYAARKKAEVIFSPSEVAKRYAAVYENVLRGHGSIVKKRGQ